MVTVTAEVLPAGISVALLTPVTSAGELDLPALDRLVARALAGGVVGLSPVGSTGEGWRLSAAQRLEVVSRVAGKAAGRPVIAGVPLLSVTDALAELHELARAGATAVLVAPPGYYAGSDDESADLFETLADRSPLPLVLYHIPALARAGFSPALAARLAAHPGIAGLKDSSRDLEYLRAVVRATSRERFRVVTGTDALLTESLDAGAAGAIAPSPCVAPDWAVELHRAWTSGERADARRRQDRLLDLVTACRAAGFPAGWKAAAALVGACGEHPVPPARPPSGDARGGLQRELHRLGLAGAGPDAMTEKDTREMETGDGA